MAQGNAGMIQTMKPGLNGSGCDALKKRLRKMACGFSQKIT